MLGLQILPPIGKENLRNYIKKKKNCYNKNGLKGPIE